MSSTATSFAVCFCFPLDNLFDKRASNSFGFGGTSPEIRISSPVGRCYRIGEQFPRCPPSRET
ncbi:hypothetical protein CDAR_231331, partial [Caerostris darwini]